MASSVVFVQRKNQSRVERVEIAGGDVPVATLRQLVATNNHLDVREVELSTSGTRERILTDGCPDVPRQSTVLMRRKPVAEATQGQRLLGQQTRAWRRSAPARPQAAQTPLSQQPQSAIVFGIGTFPAAQAAGTGPAAYAPSQHTQSALQDQRSKPVTAQQPVQFSLPSGQASLEFDPRSLPPPPPEFTCASCSSWIVDAVVLPCTCYVSVCACCAQSATSCPSCKRPLHKPSTTQPMPNRNLRAIVLKTVSSLLKQKSSPPTDAPSPPSSVPGLAALHASPTSGPYAILGLSSHATQKEVQKAYHSQAVVLHPDKNGGDAVKTAAFVRLTAAYELLSDVKARRRHDDETLRQAARKRQRR